MSDKLDLIIGLVKETKSEVKEIWEEQIKQGVDIRHNKESLIEHIKRTDLLEESLDIHKKDNEDRFGAIEEPRKARKFVMDILLKTGAGAGAMFAVIKLIEYFSKNQFFKQSNPIIINMAIFQNKLICYYSQNGWNQAFKPSR